MANDFNALPFELGTYDSSDTSERWEGREFWVPDVDISSGLAKPRAYGPNGWRRIRVVRNKSGVALLPGMLATFKSTAYGKQVDGYSAVTATECYPVDEFLPSTGVPADALFYIVMEGPALVRVSATAAQAVISAGSLLVSVTAAASTHSTTAGRVSAIDLSGATAVLGVQILNRIGVMLTASTTGNTNTNLLAYIKPH